MSKGLEALKEMRKYGAVMTPNCEIIEKELKEKEELEKAFDSLSKDYEKVMKELSKEIEKNRALEIIKVLFQGRAKLYERNDGIEKTIDKNGNYHKCNCVVYILEFYSGSIHYEFHLHKDEYDLLKEVLL